VINRLFVTGLIVINLFQALLMSCNHTVITRGTYSMWAGVLAGGEYYTEYGTIVPSAMMNPEN
jgi:hypothetical protein